MQELATVVLGASEMQDFRDFEDAAIKWVTVCLKTYNGELLRKGMELAACMVEFKDLLSQGS